MFLLRHQTDAGPRWALDSNFLPPDLTLGNLLELSAEAVATRLSQVVTAQAARGPLLAPLEPQHEVWAAGVTYLRSRDARKAESQAAVFYELLYEAERPEVFFKAVGWRVAGAGAPIRVRVDSRWNVPEPELVLAFNSRLEIVGYCAGNDVSSRDIEGANPLYLPQAKVYNGSCALGPKIALTGAAGLADLPINLTIKRASEIVFRGETSTASMKRKPEELLAWLGRELSFPLGGFLMTGTGIVPGDDFSLRPGDVVRVRVGELELENPVSE
jgi:2-dehydro-3-deoxy-D-arabinonate dehydratase